jgi:hypothetical protein
MAVAQLADARESFILRYMNMKTLIKPVLGALLLGAALAAAYRGGGLLFVHAFAQSDSQVRPYIMHTEEWGTDEQNKGAFTKLVDHSIVRRQDGTVSDNRVPARPYQGSFMSMRVVSFPTGRSVEVDDHSQSKSTMQLPAEQAARAKAEMANPPANCAYRDHPVDGVETLFGQKAVRVTLLSNQNRKWIAWELPDFSCVVVKRVVYDKDESGQWAKVAEMKLTSFVSADPDLAQFTGFDNYAEVGPTELTSRFLRSYGITPDQCPNCFREDPNDEQRYNQLHPK